MLDLRPGTILDERYEIQGLLGSGGMGRVYKARQLNLDRDVAIKVPSQAVLENEQYLTRFIREAQACARVAHENIVAIYDVKEGAEPYIVMEFVNGLPLHRFLKEERTAVFVQDLLDIIRQICEGLAAAHARGVVHRDIKPANVVITNDTQRVKIMDFGIARVADTTSMTGTGSMMGTPYYMAPEQIRGEPVSAATDIYALSCLVYQLFTGRPVFEGEVATLVFLHISQEPVDPCKLNPMLPRETSDTLLRGLRKSPEDRYQTTMEFHRQIRRSLRSVAQLPYTQVFSTRDPNLAPTDPPAHGEARTNHTAASKRAREASAATSLEQPAIAEQPKGPKPEPVPLMDADPMARTLTPPEALAKREAEEKGEEESEPRRRSRAGTWGFVVLVALFVAVLAAAATYFVMTRKDDANPASLLTEGPEAVLRWPGATPPDRFAVGDYLTLMWCVEPPEAAGLDTIYRVELTRDGADDAVIDRQTGVSRLAYRFAEPGQYELLIRSADTLHRRLRPLSARFVVSE